MEHGTETKRRIPNTNWLLRRVLCIRGLSVPSFGAILTASGPRGKSISISGRCPPIDGFCMFRIEISHSVIIPVYYIMSSSCVIHYEVFNIDEIVHICKLQALQSTLAFNKVHCRHMRLF